MHFPDGNVNSFDDSQPVGFIDVGRLVNDILVCATTATVVYQLKDLIVASNNQLGFTSEKHQWLLTVFRPVPEGGGRVMLKVWQTYGQAPASAFSCHTGTAKRALVNGLISTLRKRSCCHLMGNTMQRHVARSSSAG